MDYISSFMPVVATIIGALLAIISGMNLAKQDQILRSLAAFDARLLEYSMIQVRHDEKLLSLIDVVKSAHKRIDEVEAHRG